MSPASSSCYSRRFADLAGAHHGRHPRGLARDRGAPARSWSSTTPGTSRRSTAPCTTSPARYPFDPEPRTTSSTSPPAPTSRRSACSCSPSRATSPRACCRLARPRRGDGRGAGVRIIDLDLSNYDRIASRFAAGATRGRVVPQVGHRDPQRGLQPAHRAHRAAWPIALARADAAHRAHRRGQVAARRAASTS